MFRAFIVCCILSISLHPFSSGAISAAFDPVMYVSYNPIIIDGTLLSDVEVQQVERLEGEPGWFYPTNRACILVQGVVRQIEGPAIAIGDTICIRYATSNSSMNPDQPDMMQLHTGSDPALGVKVGERKLMSFNLTKGGEFRRGSRFSLDKNQQEEVLKAVEIIGDKF